MSSHREAPEISKDPVADGTDVYAFVSPKRPDYVTLIANFIPLRSPTAARTSTSSATTCSTRSTSTTAATRPATSRSSSSSRRRSATRRPSSTTPAPSPRSAARTGTGPQFYTLTRVDWKGEKKNKEVLLGKGLRVPPVNVGARSTPDYAKLSAQAVHDVKQGIKVFCGQRADAFHVDLGSIFDLGALRPLNEAHLISMPNMNGVNSVQSFNVHTIALEIPIKKLTRDGSLPTNPLSTKAVIGVWATASRRKSKMWDKDKGKYVGHGPWKQVSRLANPLFNEVIVPMAEKDEWNARPPWDDKRYTKYVNKPELQGLLPVLYPGAFPNLAKYSKPRADLNAVLMTGIPKGVVPGFQNFTGAVQADMLRLNMAIKPTAEPNDLGLVAGDAAGWPNGRRVNDDVVTVALRAVAGLTMPLVDPTYKPDGAASAVADGTSNTNAAVTDSFPFLGLPGGGYQTVPGTTTAK